MSHFHLKKPVESFIAQMEDFLGGVYTWNKWGAQSTIHSKGVDLGLYIRKGAYIYIIYIVCKVI